MSDLVSVPIVDADLAVALDHTLDRYMRRDAWDMYEAKMWVLAMANSEGKLILFNLDNQERYIILKLRARENARGIGSFNREGT